MRKREYRKASVRGMSFLVMAAVLAGCGQNAPTQTDSTGSSSLSTEESTGSTSSNLNDSNESESLFLAAEEFSDRDFDSSYEESSKTITLNGTSAVCDSEDVEISGTTITIKDAGTYILTGTLENGMIIVDAGDSDKVQLVLDGVSINNEDSAAIYVREADKVFLTLPTGTTSTLSNGGSYVAVDENHIDAAVFAKSDLTLQGSGSLTITAEAGHAVVCKDSLVVTGGTYVITAEEHGLDGKDNVSIAGGSFHITSGKDGIHAENKDDASLGYLYIQDGSFVIEAEGDAMSAESDAQIDGGEFQLTSGGGVAAAEPKSANVDWNPRFQFSPNTERENGTNNTNNTENTDSTEADEEAETGSSTKGIKAEGSLLLNGGSFVLDSADDALHSMNVSIYGGEFSIQTGDDGIHADEILKIHDGSITISQSYEGLEGAVVEIYGGDMDVTASDDGMNAADASTTTTLDTAIRISGGTIVVAASGDGLDSNGDLEISGGEIYISTAEGGPDTAVDYDGQGTITGGTLVAVGSSAMLQSLDSEVQGVICTTIEGAEAGTEVTLIDNNGNEVVTWTPTYSYHAVLISSPQLEENGSYTLKVGETETEIVLEGLSYSNGVSQMWAGGGRPEGAGFGRGEAAEKSRPSEEGAGAEGVQPPEGKVPSDESRPSMPPEGKVPSDESRPLMPSEGNMPPEGKVPPNESSPSEEGVQ
ncbi:MAG: carbohydrate-binding domain-containing protein [bacterium]|nr:carbohydrate-binding domain-containing protein [bacterium]